ncbi:acylneuraminate cytidylyltransferase family protein [Magnetospirillum sp. SS-4]|uniref:acylneuraminate cytidylyltransferase family protein n=1 Tax=Magnetospirillum sp. SS-4 TaxID=2681465 RepID=UPI0013861D74|nr:acylneuraminate cytidylyltransferase family protein [Magnetospirillum sp. SS-4]CAA7614391.1 CMP-N-acetylneuraminic acid synthetase [Magnetospirillum sp. SS-4]
MIDGLSVLALITARGGSKGLPGKNVRPLGGKPLVAWSVEQARTATLVDRVVISSDDAAIIDAAVTAGAEAPFVRPAALADDSASSADAVRHALGALDRTYDLLALLQPTSPLRLAADVDACIRKVAETGAPSCVGVTPAAKPPWWMQTMDEHCRLSPLLPPIQGGRRQDLPVVYVPNGAVYVVRVPWFLEHGAFLGEGSLGYVMPAERSVDIDSLLDFRLAEAVLADSKT